MSEKTHKKVRKLSEKMSEYVQMMSTSSMTFTVETMTTSGVASWD